MRRTFSLAVVRAARPLGLVLVAIAAVAGGARDAMPQSAILRQPSTAFYQGKVEDYANGRLTVRTTDGNVLHAIVSARSKIALLKPAQFSDLQPDTYIASTGHDVDGGITAIELRIVEDRLRGLGDGHRPFHYGEDNVTSTNAKVVSVSAEGEPREIAIRVRGRDMKISLPDKAPILFQTVGDDSAITPGAPVTVFTVRSRSGNTDVVRISIGLDGVVPKL